MLVRVRSNVGVWRIDGLNEDTATVADVLQGIARTRPHVIYEKPLSRDPACTSPLDNTGNGNGNGNHKTLKEQNLGHGAMVHCRVDPASCADIMTHDVNVDAPMDEASANLNTNTNSNTNANLNMKRIIDKDGSIQLVPTTEVRSAGEDRGFRRGMLPLRDIKMAWTLNEFVAMDAQFVFKMQRQETSVCKQVSLDAPSVHDFQSYLQRFQFKRNRFGFLYGKYTTTTTKEDGENANSNANAKCIIEAIYEPPQQPDPNAAEGFEQLEDPQEDVVDQIAKMCGLQKVGWIFGHPPRETGFVLSASEIIMAAELQLEAAGGIEETPFVTVKVTTGDDAKTVSVEAFQVSQQCMAMVAEEALELDTNPRVCRVNHTFSAIQEGKESKTIDNNFFLTLVPIVQHTSELFVSKFPKANRDLDDRTPSHDELKRQLSKSGTAGWTFIDLLSDFNLLIYLSKFLDVNADFPKICQAVVDRSVPLDDGYKIIITSMAGVQGAY
jgi:nuclear protein localization family protein 4